MPGASCGTIGPQSADVGVIRGVDVNGHPHRTQAPVPWWIIGAALALAALGIYVLTRRKTAALWTLGATMVAVLLVSGFAWGIFASPN